MSERRVTHRTLVVKNARKRPLEKPRCRWEDNVKMGVIKIGWNGLKWVNVVQNVPSGKLL
jgi:hypothetical protein